MVLFLDTEFTGLRQQADLIAIGLVSEEDHAFYGEFTDYDESGITDWHRDNVLPFLTLQHLPLNKSTGSKQSMEIRGDRRAIGQALKSWLDQYDELEIWADVLAYDWVFFCELFGGALQIPKSIFYIPFDLATLLKAKGLDPDIDRVTLSKKEQKAEKAQRGLKRHHALDDARILKQCYQYVIHL